MTENHLPEVLAPCGSLASVKAAIHGGADAVYLGYGDFNARRNAKNFTLEELKNAVALCHENGVAVYAALNTLVFPDELNAAVKTAREAAEAGVDAFIVQDLGLARLLRRKLPHIPLHASTQLSVHSVSGAKLLYERGFTRIVLARELTLQEIAEIKAALPENAEIEVFVHGALCMSVSGQCRFSALLGGRSGNRGLCAQTCRLPFSNGENPFALSLKDMSHIRSASELAKIGVSSLKIEGRMKRPEYTAISCYCLRKALEGQEDREALSLLQSAFSRSGFTDGYLTGKRGSDMFGVRTKEDAHLGERINQRINELTRSVYPRLPLKLKLKAESNSPVSLTATDIIAGNTVTLYGSNPQRADKPADLSRIKESLTRLGGTPCFCEEPEVDVPPNLFLPLSEINSLRREAVRALMAKRFGKSPQRGSVVAHVDSSGFSSLPKEVIYDIRAESFEALTPLLPPDCRVTLPISSLTPDAIRVLTEKGHGVCAELPRLVFGEKNGEALKERLYLLKKAGLKAVVCDNVGHAELVKDCSLTAVGGFGLNITNPHALSFYRECGLSEFTLPFEMSLQRAAAFCDFSCGALVYGRLPVMLMRNCPMSGKTGCADCKSKGKGGSLTDRRGESFPLLCRHGYSELLNSRPLYMGDKQAELYKTGVSRFVFYFTSEAREEQEAVLEKFKAGLPLGRDFTRALYLK